MNVSGNLIPTNELSARWEHVHRYIAEACETSAGRLNLEDVALALRDGDMQLWEMRVDDEVRAVLVTEIVQYPRKRVLVCALMAGEGLAHIVGLYPHLREWARDVECDQVEIVGRHGWARALGIEPANVTLIDNIEDTRGAREIEVAHG